MSFLLDESDTVLAYENKGKTNEQRQPGHDPLMSALDNLNHVQQLEIIHGIKNEPNYVFHYQYCTLNYQYTVLKLPVAHIKQLGLCIKLLVQCINSPVKHIKLPGVRIKLLGLRINLQVTHIKLPGLLIKLAVFQFKLPILNIKLPLPSGGRSIEGNGA